MYNIFKSKEIQPFFIQQNMKIKIKAILVATAISIAAVGTINAQNKDQQTTSIKISQLIKKMTLKEKVALLHANGIFTTSGVERLGIPGLSTDDGPLGVREDLSPGGGWAPANLTTDSATFFPNGAALAATWNPLLANQFGIAMGQEARARNKDIMLAPAFNIARTPLGGRKYEYYSEDPYLNAQLAVATVKGMQSQHVAACVKHYALNNQETNRDFVNVEVSERALREIYLPAFKASIEDANAWTIMSAYNKVRGQYCSENAYLLDTILKKEWRFKGIVISDWGGTHSTVDAFKNGLDVEMGSKPPYDSYYFANPLLDAVKTGKVTEKAIDEKVQRILWVIYKTSLSKDRPKGSINTPEHSKTVYAVAAESIVLLKNEKQLLPLKTSQIKSIAVIGDNAIRTFHSGGFGAGVKAKYEITALQGLQNTIGKSVEIKFAQGYKASIANQKNEVDNKPDMALIAEAVTVAKNSDIAILIIGGNRDYESESRDRIDLSLPFGEQVLVDAVTAVNVNTIVVVVGGAPYDINAIKKNNHTILFSWYNGSEGGNALADVLTGKINPSGKLPFTFPVVLDESPAHHLKTFPGDNLTTIYKEGILVGYRWYDTKKITPLYAFGYGLSYTNFNYSGLKLNKKTFAKNESISVTIQIKNTGKVGGKETVQFYVSKTGSKVERAEKELKAFKKIMVAAGEKKTIVLTIPIKNLAFYNEKIKAWEVETGAYSLQAGSSSGDIRQKVSFNVQ